MDIEEDSYSFIKYINIINKYNDGYGSPTIHALVEMGLLSINDKFICRINNTSYECYIDKDNQEQYVLCYENTIKHSNAIRFIIKLSKFIKIKITYMGNAYQRLIRMSDNKSLLILCFELRKQFEDPLTDMLMDSEFGIWEIHRSFNHADKKKTFICQSNTKYDDILRTIHNTNLSEIDVNTRKKKQQLFSLLKSDAVKIIYQPRTDKDYMKLDKGGDDLCYGSGIYRDQLHLEGSVTLFVKNNYNNHHYALTAKHVTQDLDIDSIQIKTNINSFEHLSISSADMIELNYDAVLFKVTGAPYCKIPNLDCTALSNEIYKIEYSTSNDSSSEPQENELQSASVTQLGKTSFESL
jgi:hypothetical protein